MLAFRRRNRRMAGKAGRIVGVALAGVLGAAVVVAALTPGGMVRRGAVEAVRAVADGADVWLADRPVSGIATVTDGDTLRIGSVKVRLFGIDAPESAQVCNGWPCGAAATARLAELAGAGPATCTPRDVDRYGRLVATCTVAGVDIGGQLVAEGLARAYVRYADDYASAEAAAKGARAGLWRGETEAPWTYRAERALERVSTGPGPAEAMAAQADGGGEGGDCAIKGNVSAGGRRIYHVPGSRAYARTRIDPEKGERWFCSEVEARAAGFRPPRG
jgi:endonuclease YncB( thermonuclease family)